MNQKKAQDVFIPGALPESTYITRKTKSGFTYEERLKQALSMNGYLTSISGPSKIGKTVLCEKVIGINHLVEVSGSDFNHVQDLWEKIGTKAGMPFQGDFSNEKAGNSQTESYILTKESVIEYYKEKELVLLLDDFHYATNEMQMYMAQQFKDAIRKGFKVIIVSLPHRSDDAIRTNPDLQGRICIIDIEAWTKEELKQIPITGFKELDVTYEDGVVDKLAEESLCSPHLIQLICLNICLLENVDNVKDSIIGKDILKKAFRFSTMNFNYQQIAMELKQGKNSRGNKRKEFQTEKLGNLDLYGLILEALAIDPPFSQTDFEGITERVLHLVTGEEKPTTKALKEYLKNLQEFINSKGRSYEVIEWKDNILYILEPLFLFYLRWGRE